jgi:signal transduction histidine kinase
MLKFFTKKAFELSRSNLDIFLAFVIVSALVNFFLSQILSPNIIIKQFHFINLFLASIAIALLIQKELLSKNFLLLFFTIKLVILPLTIFLISHYSLIFFGNLIFSLFFLTLLLNKRFIFFTLTIGIILSLLYSFILTIFYQKEIEIFLEIILTSSNNWMNSLITLLAIIALLYYKKNEFEIKLDAIKNLSKIMANEIFPTISTIESHLQLATKNDLTGSKLLLKCQAARNRINFIIDNIKNLNNITNLTLREFSAKDLMLEIVRDYSDASEKPVKINLIVHNDILFLGATQFIKSLFYNIIDNAFQHGGFNVKLDIIITGEEILIQDNGQGILNDDLEVIFKPFTSSEQNHLGIGLTVCKEIMTKHGGEITYISLPKNHTTFIIKLPKK